MQAMGQIYRSARREWFIQRFAQQVWELREGRLERDVQIEK
jgi:hypothetical protein